MFQLIHVFLMGGFPSTWPRIGWCWMPLSIAASCGRPCLRSRGWIWTGRWWKWTKWRCVFLMLWDVVGSISGFEVLFLFCCRNMDISWYKNIQDQTEPGWKIMMSCEYGGQTGGTGNEHWFWRLEKPRIGSRENLQHSNHLESFG